MTGLIDHTFLYIYTHLWETERLLTNIWLLVFFNYSLENQKGVGFVKENDKIRNCFLNLGLFNTLLSFLYIEVSVNQELSYDRLYVLSHIASLGQGCAITNSKRYIKALCNGLSHQGFTCTRKVGVVNVSQSSNMWPSYWTLSGTLRKYQ